ncbi:MAG TPA: hypothetical protein VF712_19365 [Thermoleophilaceae bacterium]|jgi:Ca2+-binding RTX toxin-like protein
MTDLRRTTALSLALLAIALPARASAATVEVSASSGPAAEEYVLYRASGSERNRVQVQFLRDTIVILDKGVARIGTRRRPFGVCRTSGRPNRVVCPRFSISVSLKAGDDTITFAPGKDTGEPARTRPFRFAEDYEDTEGSITETAYVHGGSGDDRIQGSQFADFIVPSKGRDKVFARGGGDWVQLEPDGEDDYVRAAGGVDALRFNGSRRPVTVDLAAGTASAADGETDSIAGFERLHGGQADDVLLGTELADAIYGEAGSDRIDGRDGSDLLSGESPSVSGGSPNQITGGEGDDFVDARSDEPAPTSAVDCGAGSDNVAGETDDRLDGSCELVAFRPPNDRFLYEQPDFDLAMRAFPVAREAGGDPVYEFPCPGAKARPNGGCSGAVALTSPEGADYGSGAFTATPGQAVNVAVALNGAGKAALAAGTPVVVRVTADLAPPPGSGAGAQPAKLDFGWQQVLAP